MPAPAADYRLEYGSGEFHFGHLRLPRSSKGAPIAILIHGGFWQEQYDLEHLGHVACELTAAGIATWNVEYHRVGNVNGGWPGTFRDVALAADYVGVIAEQFGLDSHRTIAVGHSAGAHLALWLGCRTNLPMNSELASFTPFQLHGVISLAGVTDLRTAWERRLGDTRDVVERFMKCRPDQYPDRYRVASPIELLPITIPRILIHGIDDRDVPVDFSQKYHRIARLHGDDVSLITLDGVGHFDLIDPRRRAWKIVRSAVLELLEL